MSTKRSGIQRGDGDDGPLLSGTSKKMFTGLFLAQVEMSIHQSRDKVVYYVLEHRPPTFSVWHTWNVWFMWMWIFGIYSHVINSAVDRVCIVSSSARLSCKHNTRVNMLIHSPFQLCRTTMCDEVKAAGSISFHPSIKSSSVSISRCWDKKN